jgi:hypothetical protein
MENNSKKEKEANSEKLPMENKPSIWPQVN